MLQFESENSVNVIVPSAFDVAPDSVAVSLSGVSSGSPLLSRFSSVAALAFVVSPGGPAG